VVSCGNRGSGENEAAVGYIQFCYTLIQMKTLYGTLITISGGTMKMNRLLVSGFIFLFFVLTPFLGFNTAFAATIRVPGDQATIQSGIYAASPGDTVLVANGVYTGYGNKNITFGGLAITVKSENGPGNCIIDCEKDGRGFKFFNNEGLDSILSGFTVRNGLPDGYENEDGGGIYIYPGFPEPKYIGLVVLQRIQLVIVGELSEKR